MRTEKRGKLVNIYTASDKGLPMVSHPQARVISGKGIAGDRYAEGLGAYSNSKRPTIRQISLISREAVRQANVRLDVPFPDEEMDALEALTRRSLVTEDVDLNELVGRTFTVGSIFMHGVELAVPCKRPERLDSRVAGFEPAFQDLGGIRAEVMTSGLLVTGDLIY